MRVENKAVPSKREVCIPAEIVLHLYASQRPFTSVYVHHSSITDSTEYLALLQKTGAETMKCLACPVEFFSYLCQHHLIVTVVVNDPYTPRGEQ